MPARLQQPTEEEKRSQLCISIRQIFEQAGQTAASHNKNYVVLYKIHQEFAGYMEYLKKGKRELIKLTGEKQFQDTFKLMLIKVLPLKKGETTGDRIIKFVGGYIRYINEQVHNRAKQEEDSGEEEDNPTASRFTAHLLHWFFDGFLAKDKNVRFRVLQSVAEMIAHLGAIDEDDYKSLRTALIDRLNDKESVVRYQAVISLAKLCGTEDDSELADGEPPILDILLRTMAQDESADVRRAVLINIPIEPDTLLAILDRTGDTDTNMRKAVYDSVLGKHVLQGPDENIMGPTHPRVLSIKQRELIVKNGLGDREPAVRAVAANLLATWVDVADMDSDDVDRSSTAQDKERFESRVLAFLNLFDLNEGEVATNALSRIFQVKADIVDNIQFDDTYWTNLSPERAYLARVFIEHCMATNDDVRLESVLPVVTLIAFRTQEWYNLLQDEDPVSQDLNDGERRKREDETASKEVIVAELLKLAVNLDYADEIGRRKMFELVRSMLRQETLPLRLMAPCLDVLRKLSATERDLIRLVVEIVQELRDSDDNEDVAADAFEDADQNLEGTQQPKPPQIEDLTPEQKTRLDQINLRCLSLCQLMLERVNGTFEKNIMLDGILQELIIPSVQRKDEIFRELGIKCLGLCCLIAKPLAIQTIQLLMGMMASASRSVKIALAYSFFDIFLVHEAAILKIQNNNTEALTTFLLHHIENEQDPEVKAIFCKGTCKLVLPGMITDVKVVKNLIKVYVSPATVDNQELRQCLAYFLPTYSHSSSSNQRTMREIFVHIFLDICQDRKEAEEEDEIIGSQQVAEMFLHWTDPEALSKAMLATPGGRAISDAEEAVHLDLAADILRILFEKDLKITIEKEEKKVLCQLLNRLHIPNTVDDYKIRSIKLLIDHLRARRPLRDSSSNTALSKFESTIVKKFEKQLEHFSEEEFRKFEELNELFEFLDSIIPFDDEELFDPDPRKRGTKRRSESVMTSTNTEADSFPGSPPPEARNGKKKKTKRPRLSSEGDGEDDGQSTRGSMPPPKVPIRNLPRRAAAARKPVQAIVISDDEDEIPSSKQKSGARSFVKQEEAQLDKDLSALFGNNSVSSASALSHDSIMGPESEGEEDEVNDLLAKE